MSEQHRGQILKAEFDAFHSGVEKDIKEAMLEFRGTLNRVDHSTIASPAAMVQSAAETVRWYCTEHRTRVGCWPYVRDKDGRSYVTLAEDGRISVVSEATGEDIGISDPTIILAMIESGHLLTALAWSVNHDAPAALMARPLGGATFKVQLARGDDVEIGTGHGIRRAFIAAGLEHLSEETRKAGYIRSGKAEMDEYIHKGIIKQIVEETTETAATAEVTHIDTSDDGEPQEEGGNAHG